MHDLAWYLSLCGSAAVLLLIIRLLSFVLRIGRAGASHGAVATDDRDSPLPPPGQWDPRKACGRWEDPLERNRYNRARGHRP